MTAAELLKLQALKLHEEARNLTGALPAYLRPIAERFLARWLELELAIINELEKKPDGT